MKSKAQIQRHLELVEKQLEQNLELRNELKRNGTLDLPIAQKLDVVDAQYRELKSRLKRHLWCRSS